MVNIKKNNNCNKSRENVSFVILQSGVVLAVNIVLTILALLLLWIDSRALGWRAVYTALIALSVVWTVWMIITSAIAVFDQLTNNDSIISTRVVLEITLSFIIVTTSVTMLYWVWDNAPSRDTFWTELTDTNPWRAWYTFLYITVLILEGLGYGRFVPTSTAAEDWIAVSSFLNFFYALLLFSSLIALVLDNTAAIKSGAIAEPSKKRKRKATARRRRSPSERVLRSGFVAAGTVVLTILALLLLWIDSRALGWRVVYTAITGIVVVWTIWMIITAYIVVYDSRDDNDSAISILSTLDVVVAYIIMSVDILMLYWVWSNAPDRDTYWTDLSDSSPWRAWYSFFYTESLILPGVGYTRIVPTSTVAEDWITIAIIFNYLFKAFIFSSMVAVAIDNVNSSKKNKNGRTNLFQTGSGPDPSIIPLLSEVGDDFRSTISAAGILPKKKVRV